MQNFLGHASAKTTMDHYVHLDESEQRTAMEQASWGDDE